MSATRKRNIAVVICLCVFINFVVSSVQTVFAGWDDGGDEEGGTTTTTTVTTTSTTTTTTIQPGLVSGYLIESVGVVEGETMSIALTGVRNESWANFALWMDDNMNIWFKTGDVIHGRVHSNTKYRFSGSPEFYGKVTSAASTYDGDLEPVIFHDEFLLDVEMDTMANVDFDALKDDATITAEGAVEVLLAGPRFTVTSGGTTNIYAIGGDSDPATIDVDSECMLYVESKPSYGIHAKVGLSGTLDGRLTIVSDESIELVDSVTYESDPAVNPGSDDALGLIAGMDIEVTTDFPDNGKIYAHMMATGNYTINDGDGSFYVEDYWNRDPSGILNVYGGIVQQIRGAVGTFSGSTLNSGFDKNYIYDERFMTDPPPYYPHLANEYVWEKWIESR